MEKPTLNEVRNVFAVEKGYKDWEELLTESSINTTRAYKAQTKDTFDDLEEEYEDWLDSQPAPKKAKKRPPCTCPVNGLCDVDCDPEMQTALEADQEKLDNLQAGIPKEHSLKIDPTKLDGYFDPAKQYETVCGFDVRVGFVEKGIIYGYVNLGASTHPMFKGWLPGQWNTLDLNIPNRNSIETVFGKEPGELTLREKKARKQISHTFYVSKNGIIFDYPNPPHDFAQVTVNIEVQEGDKIVLTR